ncbi:hypothetical protein GCM10023191_012650 [Actinoallomurus oryzae]|uniref:Transposase n=1 Tax=Actinoallomurus oryzae TaxID=502180 RepID=A0ABP8PH57_9ACTN
MRTPTPGPDRPAEFKPKNDGEYVANVAAHTQRKTRKHETVIREYGKFLQGLEPVLKGWVGDLV